jgi:diacylglycerol kinase family enzyme
MAKAKIIVNPYSGRWKGQSSGPAVEAALREAGVDFDLVCTAGPDHAIELAREAALGGYSPVVAAGGDGTIVPLPVVADGEIMTTEAHRLEIEVRPGRMQVLY